MLKEKTAKPIKCGCGEALVGEDAEFWGECKACRLNLPIQTSQGGDTRKSGGEADRAYHGGLGPRGEW